jgi:hypothetical protein
MSAALVMPRPLESVRPAKVVARRVEVTAPIDRSDRPAALAAVDGDAELEPLIAA